MSLYRKAKPGEIVTQKVDTIVDAKPAIVDTPIDISRRGAYVDKERRKTYQREWVKAKRAKVKQDVPPADLKDIWLLTAELG